MKQQTIWKLTLVVTDSQDVSVPAGAEWLCAREQNETIALWFRCDPHAPSETRRILIFGTGHPIPVDSGMYLGTASLRGGDFIFHVFHQRRGER